MKRENINTNRTLSAVKIFEIVTQRNRAKVFESIAPGKKTFEDLLEDVKISKGGLSNILRLLSTHRLIKSKPFDERVTYELTPLGNSVRDHLNFCETLMSTFLLPEVKKVVLSSNDFIKLIEKHDFETLQYLLTDWKIILSPLGFEQVIEWIDHKILSEEFVEKYEKIEDLIYSQEFVEVLENYEKVERAIQVEFYLRKQKKLSPEQAELVATAVDQSAIIASLDEKILRAGLYLGVTTVNLDKLIGFLNAHKLRVIRRTVMKTREEDFVEGLPRQFSKTYDLNVTPTNIKIVSGRSGGGRMPSTFEKRITINA